MWSPDGDRIAYITAEYYFDFARSNLRRLNVMAAVASHTQAIAEYPIAGMGLEFYPPEWSPGG